MRKIALCGLWAGALLPLTFCTSALASVDVQTFDPAFSTSYVYTEDALMQVAPGDSKWTGERLYFHSIYNYVDDPLVEFNQAHSARTNILVNDINTLDLGVGYMPLKNLMFGVDLPMDIVGIPNLGQQFGLGDTTVLMKWRVTPDDSPVAVAVVPEFIAPTGDQNLYVSNGGVGEGMMLVVERDFGPFRASANIGYRHNSGGQYLDINYGNQIPMALGLYIPIDDQWGVNVEAMGALSAPINQYNNPGEFYAGGHYQISEDASVLLGAATGSLGGGGSGDFRVIAGVKFSPMDLLVSKPAPVVRPVPRPVMRVQPVPPPRPVYKPYHRVLRPVVKSKPKPKPRPRPKPVRRRKPKPRKHVRKHRYHPHRHSVPTPSAHGANVEITTTTTTTTRTQIGGNHPVQPPKPPVQPETAPSGPRP